MFNKYIKFIDYSTVVNALIESTHVDCEDAFHSYEEYCDTGKLASCKTIDEVILECVRLCTKENK